MRLFRPRTTSPLLRAHRHLQIEILTLKNDTLKRGKNDFHQQQHRLLEIITELHTGLTAAYSHAQKCRARGYFATKAKNVRRCGAAAFRAPFSFAPES